MPIPSGRNMTKPNPSFPKILLLGLVGLGILLALGLIGLGVALFVTTRATVVYAPPTPPPAIVTPTEPPPTPTVMAGIVIMPSATPTAPAVFSDTSKTQGSSDVIDRQPTATRQPTLTPTPVVVKKQPTAVTVDGRIELVMPEDNFQLTGEAVEFGWKWLDNKGCEQPPEGYAFEIRVWQDRDFAPPMGAMDAQIQKPNIQCNPATGLRTFTIDRIKSVPGAAGLDSARLRWDVALVQVAPYNPVITTWPRIIFY
jgi:hypothetical protein